MCDQLTKEKNQLEEDKKQVKQDLNWLQTEIAGNAHSVKTLEDKMERLQKKKPQNIGHRSSTLISPEEDNQVTSKVRIIIVPDLTTQ